MAEFMRETGSALTPLQHDAKIFKEYIGGYLFSSMTGQRGSGKPIIIDDKTLKGKTKGDTARYHFIPQYWGPGIEGQNPTVRGNEKTLDEFFMDIRIDLSRMAFAKRGQMTDARTIWDFRQEIDQQMTEWFRKKMEVDVVSALTGYTIDGSSVLSGGERDSTPLVSGDHRCFRPDIEGSNYSTVEIAESSSSNNAILADITAKDIMNTHILDELQSLAKDADSKYKMRPYRTKDGNEYYILILHPKAALQIRRDARWEKRAISGLTGDKSLENDPIATGALGVWNRIILKEGDYIMTATNGSKKIARNLLLGAESAVIAYGHTLRTVEDKDDYEDRLGIVGSEIRGIKKFCFDGTDLNVAQVVCAI